MVHQAAEFYSHKYPAMCNSSEYQMVGESLFRAYPAIGHDGTRTPWALFCKDLSQRIRWIRWNEKRKSATGTVSKERPTKLFRLGGSEIQQTESTQEDFKRNVSELSAEIEKRTPNEKNIKILLNETHTSRMDWIKTLLDGRIQPILTKFPVFEYGKYIIYEFSLLIGKDALKAVSERMESLQDAVEDMLHSRSSGDSRMLPVLQYFEKSSLFDRGKGTKTKSIVVTKTNVPQEDTEQCIKTGREEAPHIILFVSEEPPKLDDIVVAGDEVAIFTPAESVLDGVLVLIATYYIFHLNYPRIYSQILGILQEYVINEPFSGKKSKKYRVLAKDLNKKMRE